ncbi:GGDEF domain-containing protein [Paenibacillus frigoriresistens]|uniref:GGDEF domain-containing protein n=1 Tax=Paenibacillus alginolyticus TaxID=59839 RepID=UPI0015641A4B|nr:GGDEF domain-containing protein [Paenibacillus frigoriresistens]NRF93309.1 GGDEF domain-containing protein [Paenibacillus frigoriresistens]
MLSIKQYLMNTAILISIIYFSGLLHKHFLLEIKSEIKEAILIMFSIFAGWGSMVFGIHLANSVIFDLRFVPIILATVYSRKPIYILLIGIGIGLARYTFGISQAATVGFINMLLLSTVGMFLSWISANWNSKKKNWVAAITLNLLNALVIAFLGVIPVKEYLAIIIPTALPANILLSFLLIWIVKDLYEEYLYKIDLLNKVSKDPLTQLNNRRAFMYYYNEYIDDTKDNKPLSIAFLDIDHFKKINDNYGHIFGDMVLQKVSKLISEHTRNDDIVARYGGEEFVIIFPNCSSDNVLAVLDKIRKSVEKEAFQMNELSVHITISAGVASTPPIKRQQLLKAADDALYVAKQNGRNKMVCA